MVCEPTCDQTSQYCDDYESTCKPCVDICLLDMTDQNMKKCGDHCSNFLRTFVVTKLDSIDTLNTYLTALVLITSVSLALLLIYGGLRSWKRLVKPGKHVVSPVASSLTKNGSVAGPSQAITMQSLQVNGRTTNGMLSPNSYEAAYNSVKTTSTRVSPRLNGGDKRRIPSEDRVPSTSNPVGCYDNPAMSRPAASESPVRQMGGGGPSAAAAASSAAQAGRRRRQLPAITSTSASNAVSETDVGGGGGGPLPYTISHSQVV